MSITSGFSQEEDQAMLKSRHSYLYIGVHLSVLRTPKENPEIYEVTAEAKMHRRARGSETSKSSNESNLRHSV